MVRQMKVSVSELKDNLDTQGPPDGGLSDMLRGVLGHLAV